MQLAVVPMNFKRGGCALVALALLLGGCRLGPEFHPAQPPTADHWLATADPRVVPNPVEVRWWQVFDDSVLDELIDRAYRQNYSLQAAGLRILQAQARRGIAVGGLFPQTQQLGAGFQTRRLSSNGAVPVSDNTASEFTIGFDAAWEIDLWGKLRRAIEAADADLLASIASYDDVLVSLIAEVATTYVQSRVVEARLVLASDNVRVQREGLRIARARYEEGGTSELDVQQATTLLADTEATIPVLQMQLRQAHDRLSVLLGVPPRDSVFSLLTAAPPSDLPGSQRVEPKIPAAPTSIAVGIPAELLRRRPDVRRAEQAAAAESARIGVAMAQLFPRLELSGSIGLTAEDAAKLFSGNSFDALAGPRFDWPVLNYGRLYYAVVAQDARFQETIMVYVDTMLRAQQEVEDALISYLRGVERVEHLSRSVAAANRAVEISLVQYREGAADYTRVLTAQQSKLRVDDELSAAEGAVTLSVISLYKALGGGWQMRADQPPVSDEVQRAVDQRSWWPHW